MEVGMIRRIDIDDEMQQSYLDYAMSVIVARALPDARDGLKPVHRRILYSMFAQGIRPDGEFRKSARIVGEVLGKYHPHGDMAVYEAMARMAQAFSMRYPLVEGQGNFGSVDGDPAAAMRYTEARLAQLSLEVIRDIEKSTVPMIDNFDGTLLEPSVLPAAIPNMLVNGSTGIAVGMATSIPPHNMTEVCEALIFMLDNWSKLDKVGLEALLSILKGPDFPTGGLILDQGTKFGENLISAYSSGRGRITVRARTHFESMSRGRSRIIVSELPYQTNKSSLIQRIADLVRHGQITGISDLRDESDRQGMRIVIELAKTADPETVLGGLFKKTPLQSTFSVIMLALVDGEPRLLSLKQALKVYLDHRIDVVRKRSQFDLERARQRAHVLEGLLLAIKNLEQVIRLIRRSADTEAAYQSLRKKYTLSDRQARAILEMPLKRLAALERKNLTLEYKQAKKEIKELETLLRSERKIRNVVAEGIERTKATYGDGRRTQIALTQGGKSSAAVMIPTESNQTWVVLDDQGRLSRSISARIPKLAGTHPPQLVIEASGQDHLYLFTERGSCACVPVYTLPEVKDPRQGSPADSTSPLSRENEIVAGFAIDPSQVARYGDKAYFILATRHGMLKRSLLSALPGPSSTPFKVMKIEKGDRLGWAGLSDGKDEICLIASSGMGIRFAEKEVRKMGLVAAGVRAIRLDKNQSTIGMEIVKPRTPLTFLTDRADAKRVRSDQFPLQGRYGKGVRIWKSGENPTFIGAVAGQKGIAVLKKGAARSILFSQIPLRSRQAGGQKLFDVDSKNGVIELRSVRSRHVFDRPSKTKSKRRKSALKASSGQKPKGRDASASKVQKARTKGRGKPKKI
jgi:DNA gyrase subunit A